MAMQPLDCERCGHRFLVEKFSAVHTSIQWTSDASLCPEIADSNDRFGERNRSCDALRRTIDRAVRDAALSESRVELPIGTGIPRLH